MASAGNLGPMDAPWNTPDPFTCVQQLQGLVGHGFNLGQDSAGDLQSLMQSALGGIRKEVDQHMDFLETEHVEQKTDHQAFGNAPLSFCSLPRLTLQETQKKTLTRPDSNAESPRMVGQESVALL